MPPHWLRALTLGLMALTASACVDAEPGAGGAPAESLDLTTKAAVSAKAPGMTLWIAPTVVPESRDEQAVWVLEGRTSKNLASALSFASEHALGEAELTSARKFDVVLDGSSMVSLLVGRPLFLELGAATGSTGTYFAKVMLAPTLVDFKGSSKLFVHEDVEPAVVGQSLFFRGYVKPAAGLSNPSVTGASTVEQQAKLWRFGWSGPELVALAGGAPIVFTASSPTATVKKVARLELAVTDVELSIQPPREVWPEPTCPSEILSCLAGLGAGADTSGCGSALEVLTCQAPSQAITAERFATDFIAALVGWYAAHGADVAASGGNTLEQAQALVSAGAVTEVTDVEEDPFAHDLSKFVVLRHPDVVWPGSDIVWFGAYDRATGALSEIYDFN